MKILFTIGLIYLIYRVSVIPARIQGDSDKPEDQDYIDYEEVE